MRQNASELSRFDLHVHTQLSRDSIIETDEIAHLARSHGLSGLAITDHNRVWAHRTLREQGLIVISGVEVRTGDSEVIGLFVEEVRVSRDPLEVIDSIHSQSGVAVLPHPYGFPRNIFSNNSEIKELAGRADAIEAFNGRNLFPFQNKKANALADLLGKAKVAGSDAHTPREIGAAYTLMRGVRSLSDIRQAILERRTTVAGSLSFPTVHLASLAASTLGRRRREHM